MSGGHFNYGCFVIAQFAEEVHHEIETNDNISEDELGFSRGYDFSKETLKRVSDAQRIIAIAGKLAREVEWLYSDDHGEESFIKVADKILEEFRSSGLSDK